MEYAAVHHFIANPLQNGVNVCKSATLKSRMVKHHLHHKFERIDFSVSILKTGHVIIKMYL